MGALCWESTGDRTEGLVPRPCPSGAGSAGEALLVTIQKAAEVVANAVRPAPGSPGTRGPLPRGDAYQAAVPPSASQGNTTPGNLLPAAILGARGIRRESSLPRPQMGS